MSQRLIRALSFVAFTAFVVSACSSGSDTSSSRRQRNAALPTPWSTTSGTADDDIQSAVAVDSDGNVISVGVRSPEGLFAAKYSAHQSGVIRVAAKPDARVVGSGLVITKRDSSGSIVWSNELESTTMALISSVGVDAKGFIYIAGTIAGSIDFDATAGTKWLVDPSATLVDKPFIAKFSPDGTYISSMRFLGDIAYMQDMAVDASGNIAVTGVYMGTLIAFASDRKLSVDGTSHFQPFVARLNTSLAIQWLKAENSSGYSSSRSIALDERGNIVLNLDFDGYALWDTPLSLVPTAIQTTSSGIMRVAARPQAPAGVVGGYWSAGVIDTLVMKLNAEGSFVWGVQLGGTGFDHPIGLGLDSSGNVYVNGSTTSAALWADPDPAAVTPKLNKTGSTIGYLARITSDGGLKSLVHIGVPVEDAGIYEPGRLAVASDGTTIMTGNVWGKVNFDPAKPESTVPTDGNSNAIAVSYASDGKLKWSRTFLGGHVMGSDVAIDSSGNAYFSGLFYTNLVVDDAMDVAVGATKGGSDGYIVKLSALGASAKAGSGTAKSTTAEPTVTPPSIDAIISGVPAPEVSDIKILPDNVPAGVNTALAQKIITVKVKKTITVKAILSTVGITLAAGSKTSSTVSAKSKKNCSATSTKVKGIKVGTCTLTIKVTPKSGKATKSKVSVVVVQ